MSVPITDSNLLAIQSQLSPLQVKLDAAPALSPLCYPNLQTSDTWTSEGDSAGIHGSCVITQGTALQPMKALFTPAKRPSGAWDNAYILHRNAYQPATLFDFVTSITFPTGQDLENCHAYEQDFQINPGHTIFNWGYQWLFGVGLRLWDRSRTVNSGGWSTDAVIPFKPFIPGVPKRLICKMSLTDNTLTYRGVAIDETFTRMNLTYPAVTKAEAQYINNAIQIDSKGKGAPITVLLNECNVTGF